MSRPHLDQDVTLDGFEPTDPILRARIRKERLIRWVDVVTYFCVMVSGALTLIQPPASVASALDPGWVVSWAVLLLVSGLFGFVGRLTRYWAIEAPGAAAGATGAALYVFVLIISTIDGQITGAVASTFVACMSLLMLRRYVELQLFTTDPGDQSYLDRLRRLLKRKTKDSIASERH